MTVTTVRAQPSMLAGRGGGGGDAQGRAATNPVAALPCARTPLPNTPAALAPVEGVGSCPPAGMGRRHTL